MATQFRRVLVPLDFSASSLSVLDVAASFVKAGDGQMLLVHVLDEPAPISLPTPAVTPTASEDAARRELAKAAPSDPGVICQRELVRGAPAAQILHLAQEENVDLIVMSTHGQSGLTRLLMGSVSAEVVRHAPCPVVTVTSAALRETRQSPGPDMEPPGAIWPMQKLHESRDTET